MNLEPGTTVGPNLRLVRLLGRGSMGSVWVADHEALGTEVAVKFMSVAMTDDEVLVERFAREAKAAARIKSPHIVQVFDAGITDDGQPYIVMELLEGEGLFQRIKRTGPLSLEDFAAVVIQTCKALAAAHEIGIVHRDIKPANIFLTESGGDLFVKVFDFGIAKLTGEQSIDMTGDGGVLGTPGYMSPEQFTDSKRVDFRSDLWSVGVVAYAALTGKRPFSGKNVGEVCLAIQKAEFPPASQWRQDVPVPVDTWFSMAMAKDPRARFDSARTMGETLEQSLGVPSVMASSPNFIASGAYVAATFSGTSLGDGALPGVPRKRSRLVVGALAVAAIAGVAGAGVFFASRGPAESASPAQTGQATTSQAAPSATAAPAESSALAAADDVADAGANPAEPDSKDSKKTPEPGKAGGASPPSTAGQPAGGDPDDRSQEAAEVLGI